MSRGECVPLCATPSVSGCEGPQPAVLSTGQVWASHSPCGPLRELLSSVKAGMDRAQQDTGWSAQQLLQLMETLSGAGRFMELHHKSHWSGFREWFHHCPFLASKEKGKMFFPSLPCSRTLWLSQCPASSTHPCSAPKLSVPNYLQGGFVCKE